jgi:hypothetical protein
MPDGCQMMMMTMVMMTMMTLATLEEPAEVAPFSCDHVQLARVVQN